MALSAAVVVGVTNLSAPALASDLQFPATLATLESVLGKDVSTLREADSGRVIDVLIDERGHLRAAVVEFGGFLGIGTRKVAVDWTAFRFAGKSIWVDVTRDQLRTAPEYKVNEAPSIIQPTNADH
jgi:hypothetical protein